MKRVAVLILKYGVGIIGKLTHNLVQLQMHDFYTYAYLDENFTPYYIGKGRGARAYSRMHSVALPPEERILMLKQNLTERQALDHERYMIYIYGRKNKDGGILENKLISGTERSIVYQKQNPEEWANDLLCAIFGNRTAACVLLFLQCYRDGHAQRIAKTFGFGLNMTQRQLNRLEENGILVSRRVGNVRLFSFNDRNPTVRHLREFLEFCNKSR